MRASIRSQQGQIECVPLRRNPEEATLTLNDLLCVRFPCNRLTPGGSSGGESAMLACGASVVGIGTDIGGSVRIPAHFSGQAALKPTARRLSLQGFRASVPGQEAIPAVAGPMAPHVEDLALIMNELWVQEAWDRDCDLVPVPMDMAEYNNNGSVSETQ